MTKPISLPSCETLTVEFKSDRSCLPDRELIEALTCLANAEGGELWLGVEDDGTPTGLHKKHTNLAGLAGMVAARTSPALQVKVDPVTIQNKSLARIQVPKSRMEIATSSGVYLRRRMKADGTPECAPLLPHDRTIRASQIGLHDASARPVPGAALDDLDPLERERLRQTIRQYGGDRVLLELDDEALDGALGFTKRQENGNRVPTLAGLLVIGRESSLRELVPTHELAFQVLERENVHFNEFRRFPLLKALEWLETNFRPYNPEKEVQIGLFRVPIPKVDIGAFREAVANALVHRDYHHIGATHVRLDDWGLTVSNPGGLIDGITLQNLLTTEPRPRNPVLADAMKRIGIVERSGRGVDKIYRGMLRFGRPEPDYSRTNASSVVLQLATVDADEMFLQLLIEEEKRHDQGPLPIESIIVLAALRNERRLSTEALAGHMQRDIAQSRRIIQHLVEAGLVQAYGNTRNRSYSLSADVYQAKGELAEYTRQAGFSKLQHEQLVINWIQQHGSIRRRDVIELCHLTSSQAANLLKRMHADGRIKLHGQRRGTYYTQGK